MENKAVQVFMKIKQSCSRSKNTFVSMTHEYISTYKLGHIGISRNLIGSLSLGNDQRTMSASWDADNLRNETMTGVNSQFPFFLVILCSM